MPVNRETSFNTKLAEVLRSKHPRWRENEMVRSESGGVLAGNVTPDIFINLITPLVIESEFMPARTVEEDAKQRLNKKLADEEKTIEQAIALRAPAKIKIAAEADLEKEIRASQFEYCLFSVEAEDAPVKRWPHEGWLKGGVDELVALIENAGITERLIRESLETLEGAIDGAGAMLLEGTRTSPENITEIARILCQSEGKQTTRMAMAILANAITFHRLLGTKRGVKPLRNLRRGGKLSVDKVTPEWRRIIKEINYFPVFDIACGILDQIPDKTADDILGFLDESTSILLSSGIIGTHDIYGRMFQRLITDRKFLATFYTLPESAQLLAEIAADKLAVDYSDEEAVKNLRIADFACGTGTLINAAYHAVLARFRRTGHDDEKIHQAMIEKSLIATDIMPAGVHLTLSILASAHPTILFGDTQTSVLSYGRTKSNEIALGALDLLHEEHTFDLLQSESRVGGTRTSTISGVELARGERRIPHANCDLVIMNPPFTRPTNHEITGKPVPSFAGFNTTEEEQKAMSNRLKKINADMPERAGHGNAGLASNFIDLANKKLKPGGVLALVLPAIFANGGSWLRSRNFINANYDDITIISIVSNGVKSNSFSADTAIAEILLIAKKRATQREEGYAKVQFVSLDHRPASSAQSHVTARMILQDYFEKMHASSPPTKAEAKASFSDRKTSGRLAHVATGCLWIAKQFLGEAVYGNLANGGAIGVLDSSLAITAITLESGELSLPSDTKSYAVPVTRLRSIAERGLLSRDINGINPIKETADGKILYRGPFDVNPLPPRGKPTYPCLWNHDSARERSFVVQPDSAGKVRDGMQKAADRVWDTRSTLHFNVDFGLSASSLAACLTAQKTIGGRAWPNVRPHDASHEPAIVLWANCTLGLLLWWHVASRQQVGRATISISRLPNLPILDTRKLTAQQHKLARKIFNRFKNKPFYPANEIYHDEVRHELDQAVLIELLGLPKSILEPLNLLRKKWCNEPSVHGGKSTRIDAQPQQDAI